MLITVANTRGGSGKSTCAMNLACELAGVDIGCTDRWQGKNRVVLVGADAQGTVARLCSGGHLPVSCDHGPLEDPQGIERWVQRIRAITMEADYIVVDGPSNVGLVAETIVSISDLVIVPCMISAVDLVTTIAPVMDLIKASRSIRSDGGPNCLLVPTRMQTGIAVDQEMQTLRGLFGEPIGPAIHEWAEFADVFNSGRWIGDVAPNSDAHGDIKRLAAAVVLIAWRLANTGAGTVASKL
jgi:chromosome partitioning protein